MEDEGEQVQRRLVQWLALQVHLEDNLREAQFNWIADDVEEAVPALLQRVTVQSEDNGVVLGKVLSIAQAQRRVAVQFGVTAVQQANEGIGQADIDPIPLDDQRRTVAKVGADALKGLPVGWRGKA